MAYSIIYRKNNEQIIIEWIAPSNWSETAIRESFKQQYSQAEIISLEALL